VGEEKAKCAGAVFSQLLSWRSRFRLWRLAALR
jgi:hypothetical protein